MKKNIILALGSVVLVAGLGTLFTQLGMDWYATLQKPSQWIASFVFPIVWTLNYAIIAYILWKLISKGQLDAKKIYLFLANGVLNVLWCLVFFTLEQMFLGNILIVINTYFAFKLTLEIRKENAIYGGLLTLYALWLSVATTLNLAIWILN